MTAADLLASVAPWAEKLILGMVTLLTWIFSRERKTIDDKIAVIRGDVVTLRGELRQMAEDANDRYSSLLGKLQRLPVDLRHEWREDMDRENGKRGRT